MLSFKLAFSLSSFRWVCSAAKPVTNGTLEDLERDVMKYLQKTQVQYLGQEYPVIKIMDTYFSTLVWRILWTEEPGGIQIMVLQRVGHN